MPPKPTNEKTSVVSATEVLSAQNKLTKERTEPMNSNAATKNEPATLSGQHSNITPALLFSLDDLQLRVIMAEGEPWFVGADVCAALEIQNASQAISRLDEDERAMFNIGRQGATNVVSEPGLYSLILGSRKPEAKRFKRWVTHDVLPSIRKTGSYAVQKQVPRDRQLRVCSFLMTQVGRSADTFVRDGQIVLAKAAYAEANLPMPDIALLKPLQIPLGLEGGAA